MKKTIGELCTLHSGGTPSTKHQEYWNGDIPWLSSSESGKGFIYGSDHFITELGVKNSATKLARKGSVVIATAGEGKTRGQVSMLEIDAYINQSLIAINSNSDELDNLFLFYYLKNSYKRLRSISDATGVRGSLSGELLKTFVIDYPNINKQKEIANFLRNIDLKIETNLELIDELASTINDIYEQWFIQCDYVARNGKPFKKSGGDVRYSEALNRKIPSSWDCVALSDLLVVLKDGTHNPPKRTDNGIPLLTGTMFGKHFLNYSDSTNISKEDYEKIHAKYSPQEGDFVVTKIGTIGNVCYLDKLDVPLAVHCNSALLRFPKRISRSYAFSYLKSEEFLKRMKAAKGQSIQEFVSLDKLGSIQFLVPEQSLMDKFEEVTKGLFDKMISLREENNELNKTMNLIMPVLLNGQAHLKADE